MKIDINKQYKTRDGQPVKIYTTEHKGGCPVVGAVDNRLRVWSANGESPHSINLNLIEVKPEKVVWVVTDGDDNTYADADGSLVRSYQADWGGTLYRVVLTDDMVVE
jgi:hypothetical protein